MVKNIIVALLGFGLVVLMACGGGKKKNMAGGDNVSAGEFIDFFPELNLPFIYGDSLFPKKENDSLLIGAEILRDFIPDSLSVATFGKSAKPKFYAVGKILNGEDETYLVTRGVTPDKKFLFIDALDKNHKYLAGMPVFKYDNTGKWLHNINFDNRYIITKTTTYKDPDGTAINGVDVYMLNAASRKFMLVMTDSLGDGFSELINPIDTLSKKQKFTGDYGVGNNNLISFRDGLRVGRLNFFLHLEDPARDCVGELKGEIIFKNENTAEYRQGNDPCSLEFVFEKNSVTIRELGGCGSRLGNIACKFDGVYQLKGTAKIIEKKKAEIKKAAQIKKADSTRAVQKPDVVLPPETTPVQIPDEKSNDPAQPDKPQVKPETRPATGEGAAVPKTKNE